MRSALHLTVTTPMAVLVDETGVRSVRAEDASGGFGILPGHTDFLTALSASVLRWRGPDGVEHFCALRGGLMTLTDGKTVAVACREAVRGRDLGALAADLASLRAEEADADRRARVEQVRLHASAVRQLMRYLRPGSAGGLDHPPQISAERRGGDA